ncbi:1298_t:CDS:2, partial [Paraglomus brasilianum]
NFTTIQHEHAYQDAKKEYDDVKAKLERLEELSIKTELSVAEKKELDRLEVELKTRRDATSEKRKCGSLAITIIPESELRKET